MFFQVFTGECVLRSACLAVEFEALDGFWTYAKPVTTEYTEHRASHAYEGSGGTPIGNGEDVSNEGMSSEHCRAYCEADKDRSCVSYELHYGDRINGLCYNLAHC